MRILFLTQYYPPEAGAAQNRLSDLAGRLTNSGHHVTVLTAVPSYPKGEIYHGYRGRIVTTQDDAGIQIVRTWAYATKKKSFVPRILNYLSFSVLSVIVGWGTLETVDVIFVESPPLFLGFSGYLLSKLKQAKFVLNISDLWPESAVALGVLRNRNLIRWVTRAEEWLYRKASLVTGQTQGIVDSIKSRCPDVRVQLMTNGVSPEFVTAAAEAFANRECVRREFGVANKFVVGYAGLHGLVYDLDAVVKAAAGLTAFSRIHFLLIGDGPEKLRLQERAKHEALTNISFFPTLPAARMPDVFTAIDVLLIPLRRDDLFKGTLPSKLFEALGAGTPVIAAVRGEAQQIIETADCGICVKPEDTSGIMEAILKLFRDSPLRRKLGRNGRVFVSNYYDRRRIAQRFESLLIESFSISSPLNGKARTDDSKEALVGQTANLRTTTHSKADD